MGEKKMEEKRTEPKRKASLLRALPVAFSLYSRIPMPRFVWGSQDMAYHLIYFPLVGLVIGVLLVLWQRLCLALSLSPLTFSLVGTALPLLLTGGFHFDGYLDTMDAIHSYGDREKKLAIMDDPHVGAFAVVHGLVFCLLYSAGLSVLAADTRGICCAAAGFVLSRTLSGLAVVTLPSAKTGGMLQTFARTAQKRAVRGALLAELLAASALLLWYAPLSGSLVLAACLITFFAYRRYALHTYQGITGDLAGWFVTLAELFMVLAAACGSLLN